jgi:opacity protein-like surface antigen
MIIMKKPLSIAACAAALALLAGPAIAEDLVFELKNGTGSTLTAFYTSPVGEDRWEEDVFGDQVLEPGESIEITIADGRDVCEYDMRFEFSEDSALDTTTDTQNLCELGSYTIHE